LQISKKSHARQAISRHLLCLWRCCGQLSCRSQIQCSSTFLRTRTWRC
jgi:hypothetical protein